MMRMSHERLRQAWPELDRLVAEWMGECYHDWHYEPDEVYSIFKCAKCGSRCGRVMGKPRPSQNFSTDDAACALVKDRLQQAGECLEVIRSKHARTVARLFMTPAAMRGNIAECIAVGDTEPHAVCLLVLKVREWEERNK